jgi:DNA-binding transcriptional MerR regulator
MDDAAMLTIGQLADHTGLPVRTIRYWSDIGAVPPAARVGRDHRRYDAAGVARLELVARSVSSAWGWPRYGRS